MTTCPRWTIRNVDDDARAMVIEVSKTSGTPVGELVTEAIQDWYEALPFDVDED